MPSGKSGMDMMLYFGQTHGNNYLLCNHWIVCITFNITCKMESLKVSRSLVDELNILLGGPGKFSPLISIFQSIVICNPGKQCRTRKVCIREGPKFYIGATLLWVHSRLKRLTT
jgi:hypothetical protein